MLEANRAYVSNRLDEAQSLCQSVLVSDRSNAPAAILLASVKGKRGENAEAIAILRDVLAHNPISFDAAFRLANLLRRIKQVDEAEAMARKAVSLRRDDVHAHNLLGLCLLDAGKHEEAAEAFRGAIQRNPSLASARNNLAAALVFLGRENEAVVEYQRALALNPGAVETLVSLGNLMMDHGDYSGAEKCARTALRAAPASHQAHLLLGAVLAEQNRYEEAGKELRSAVWSNARDSAALVMLGKVLQIEGKIDEANDTFRQALGLETRDAFTYFHYASNNRFTEADGPLIERMETALSSTDSPRHRAYLHYALGKARDDLGDFEGAIHNFDEANRICYGLIFGEREMDRVGYAALTDAFIEGFRKGFETQFSDWASDSEAPIFVIGMLRSGTTLMEVLLTCHPEVGGVGEDLFWNTRFDTVEKVRGFLETPERAQGIAPGYLSLLADTAPGKGRVVNKTPGNHQLLGPIHAVFPNAKVIHMRRNPVDTCLSIFTTPNLAAKFCFNRENIVFGYQEYQRVMEHWRSVLPAGTMLEVDYEELIAKPEATMKRALKFLGVPWDEGVLHPEKNKNAVRTPSLWQVRQPLYKRSVERWRNYEPWLGPFSELA